jgi:hypothetical protein
MMACLPAQPEAAELEQDRAICVIRWPAWPTEVIPVHLPDAVAAACRNFANSSFQLSARRVRRPRPFVADDEDDESNNDHERK